jgi:hypothetical protein
MLLKRVITAAFLLVTLIFVLWANGSIPLFPWFAIGAAVAALFGLLKEDFILSHAAPFSN